MASTGEVWKLGHRPALDGVRGIAILLVLLQHSETPYMDGGGVVGVTMFFVLSGFLITSLLLEERAKKGRVSLSAFYWRRTLRLMPALWACVAAVTIFAASLGASAYLPPGSWLAALTYTSDFVAMRHSGGALNPTWTLAVEEKFYLLWPLVLVLVSRRRALAVIAAVGIALSTWMRFDGWNDGAGHTIVQYGPHTHAASLLAGCLLSIFLHTRSAVPTKPRAGVALVALAAGCAAVSPDYLRHVWLPTLVPLLVVAALWLLVRGPEARCALAWRPLVFVGQRSYGLYLWNWPVSLLLHMLFGWDQSWLVHLVMLVPIAWGLTLLSWRYVERPFLAMKDARGGLHDVEAGHRAVAHAR